MKKSRLLFIAILLLAFSAACLFTANAQQFMQGTSANVQTVAQQPTSFEAELAPPVYSTLAQFGGVRWIAYGYLYPVGTFDNLPPCSEAPVIAPIGSYRVSGEYGNASFHAATYRLSFGSSNDGKQFVMGGIFEFALSELNQPQTDIYSVARLIRGNFEEGWEGEYTPRSGDCLGGRVKVSATQPIN